MKIKDYLKKVETANEVMALSNRCGDYEGDYEVEYKLYMEYDNYKTYSAKTWKEFQKLIKQEFIPDFADEILNGNFELNEQYYIKTSSVIFSIE